MKEDLAAHESGDWELYALLDIFPPAIRQALTRLTNVHDLIEVILDLGRLPEARFPRDFCYLSQVPVDADDIAYVVGRIGAFGKDNRAGIEQTLHRISCLRNRTGKIVGLTCRVGRAVYGTIDIIADVVRSGKSILLLGRPGVGKTTMLREVARVLSSGDLRKRVVIVDTSNEIAGDGDVPHAGIGHARRMQVDVPANQHAVMIEAVENHMPEVIVIDEIGTEAEALAARTIAERGVQLIGTAHGTDLENLMTNPTLSDLVGGIGAVTLSDEEAKRRGTRKTVLERKAPPTFDVIIEIQERHKLAIHAPVDEVVDAILRGYQPKPEIRVRNERGGVEVVQQAEAQTVQTRYETNGRHRPAGKAPIAAYDEPEDDDESGSDIAKIFPYGVSRTKIERAIANLRVPAQVVRQWDDADVVLTLKALERRDHGKLKAMAAQNMPIYALKTNTTSQIQACMRDLFELPTHGRRRARAARGRGSGLSGDAAPQAGGAVAAILVRAPAAAPARREAPIAIPLHGRGAQPSRARLPGGISIADGLFVTFEGVEGAGKTTQIHLLHEYLSETTIPFIFAREPGGTALGERLRELLIDPLGQMSPEAEALLLSAARAELVDKVIEPALKEGRIVVCDRFWDATLAYQGYGRGLPLETLMQITMFASRKLAPDITFLLDISIEKSVERLHGRKRLADRMEREKREFHERVAEGYRRLAAADPERIIMLDGTRPQEELAAQIREIILTRHKG